MGPCAHGGEYAATVIKSNGKMLFGCAAFVQIWPQTQINLPAEFRDT